MWIAPSRLNPRWLIAGVLAGVLLYVPYLIGEINHHWANLRGVESHGIFRVPSYVAAIRAGEINPHPHIRAVHTAGAASIVEADRAAGAIAMTFAMENAVSLARDHAVGWVLLRNTTHTGPMGYYARAAADLVGLP